MLTDSMGVRLDSSGSAERTAGGLLLARHVPSRLQPDDPLRGRRPDRCLDFHTNANDLKSAAPPWVQLQTEGNPPPVLTDYEKHVYDPIRNILIVYDSTAGV